MLSVLVITFLPRSKRLLLSWLQSISAVILKPKKIKSVTVSTFSSSIFREVMGLDTVILVFWMLRFKPAFSLSSLTFIKGLFSSFSLSYLGSKLHILHWMVKCQPLDFQGRPYECHFACIFFGSLIDYAFLCLHQFLIHIFWISTIGYLKSLHFPVNWICYYYKVTLSGFCLRSTVFNII